MRPGEIVGEQVAEEGFRIRVLPPRPGARPITLSVGPAPRRLQPGAGTVYRRRYYRSARTLYWVVAGELREDREDLEYISRHYDFGIAIRSALRRANKLAAEPRRRKGKS
ncbi:hypothetical protein SEA_LILMAC1015_75 [Arthrobacter phage Lilmac1015]|uniref:Uncharacterized protein n=1 Tax=Arthrobacter phage Lilmac1015 TaxID=2912653 RepID=A0AA49BQ03_9CAUD|nr:hypothetical protein SEA_LILMAC1015_75 [Arthrobacter phage Lilmac1015]